MCWSSEDILKLNKNNTAALSLWSNIRSLHAFPQTSHAFTAKANLILLYEHNKYTPVIPKTLEIRKREMKEQCSDNVQTQCAYYLQIYYHNHLHLFIFSSLYV
jgi:hypothetical protein